MRQKKKSPDLVPVPATGTVTARVPKSGTEQWGKHPASVTRDKELSATAKVVFDELALWCFKERNQVSRGVRAIATATGLSPTTVVKGLADLKERGHIRVLGEGKARRRYFLNSMVFAPRPAINEPVSLPRNSQKKKSEDVPQFIQDGLACRVEGNAFYRQQVS